MIGYATVRPDSMILHLVPDNHLSLSEPTTVLFIDTSIHHGAKLSWQNVINVPYISCER